MLTIPLICMQILSIACDNASSNNTMIFELSDLLKTFDGDPSRIRCFLHILNLIAKSLLRQFDVPKAQADEALNEAEQELHKLAEGLDLEEAATVQGLSQDDDDDDDDTDGWIDEQAEMSAIEREELDDRVRPIRLLLVKVRDH